MKTSSFGIQGARAPTEASFALQQRERELRLPARGSRAAPPATATGSASAGPILQSATSGGAKRTPAGDAHVGSSRASSRSTEPATAANAANQAPAVTRIGVISDNHGYLDPAVLEHFAGVVHIIHAGDIVDPEILASLETVAPVTAVAGNMDTGDLGASLPRDVAGEVAGVRFVVGHKRKRLLKRLSDGRLDGDQESVTPDLVVYGHDHIPAAAWVEGTLFLNPGSASAPHEEDDGPTVAIVSVKPAGLAVCFIPLKRRDAEATP